jgi:hypothetical protein
MLGKGWTAVLHFSRRRKHDVTMTGALQRRNTLPAVMRVSLEPSPLLALAQPKLPSYAE